jgi:DNA-binding MarR family transcriptional regulator
MLDLFASQLEGTSVSVSSLCVAANVPSTTALRWIRNLVEQGVFVPEFDPSDARRVFVRLSKETTRKIRRTLRKDQCCTQSSSEDHRAPFSTSVHGGIPIGMARRGRHIPG